MARSRIADATLPESLWSEALKMVIYLLNRVPSKTVTKPHISYELENLIVLAIFIVGVVQWKFGHIYYMRRS